MNFHVMTLFPEMIEQGMRSSIMGKAIEQGKISLHTVNIRDYTQDKHKKVDDYPYGGGAGMLMQAQPVYDCFQSIQENRPPMRVIYLTPQGQPFHQQMAEELAQEEDLALLCGHYEGVDERVLDKIVTDYISIGDFVLTGGELPAMVLMDAVARLVPGVLHNELSAEVETFHRSLLEFPQYSRPELWQGQSVPPVLLSGNHKEIAVWRLAQSRERTKKYRPDLYQIYERELYCEKWLMGKKLLHMDMIEALRRGQAQVLYSGEDGILLQQNNGTTAYLTAVSGEAAAAIWQKAEEERSAGRRFRYRRPELLVVHGEGLTRVLEPFGWKQECECLQAVYTQKVTMPCDRSLKIRQLDAGYVDQVLTYYHSLGGRSYIEGRVLSGTVYGAFAGDELAGFIGMHEEGSMGMLHVLDQFRRRGIAAALEADSINRMLALGFTPFAQIFTDNEASIALQLKLGLCISKEPLYWMARDIEK